ncbi:hypothetical protein CALCODRAFT_432171 [Calocera cornea HHB12733]|uniref:Glycosyltransferase 61 catalytic domain-containing protein n=1 Tax=Calocera cornea HHB12733 TaxID=1353952 RepID=A0A165GZH1_9BASI|nr:hypothetical protein CALCODRAFT_432171 [Calocera cornea HHB12733]
MFGPQREPYAADVREYWQNGKIKASNVVSHAPGFTIFENLYFLNGTAYLVSSDPESFPARNLITGSGFGIYNSPEEVAAREPTDKDMQIISPQRARELFADAAVRLHGTSWWTNDPAQFIAHYYHFSAELMFGLWRTYASLDPSITPLGQTRLPAPRRWLFPHVPADKWRDYASMNQYVLFASFPSTQLLFQQDIADMADTSKVYVLERVVYSDRSAAIRGEGWLPKQRMAALAFSHESVRNWWAPIRSNVVRFAGGDLNPFMRPHPPPPAPGQPPPVNDQPEDKPVITYVSRQTWGRRMLLQDDHDRFVAALGRLSEMYGYEVNVVNMDKLTRDEQIKLAGRTTIMCGVHGNGLTSLLWMKPTPRTTVMEFFMPQGWAFDYQWTASALGMTHYGWWNDTYVTGPGIPTHTNYVDGFQGNEIPLDGEAVARAIHERLQLPLDSPAPPPGSGPQQ